MAGESEFRVVSAVRRHGRERREAPALTGDGRTVSYGELDARSSRVAQALLAAGVRAGDRVAYVGKNAPEYFDLLFGAAKLGAVTVPVNWRLTGREITAILTDAGAAVTVADREADAFPAPGRLLRTGPEFEEWLAAHEAVDPGFTGGPDDIVAQLYTSGTTGLPKGVPLSNRNFSTGERRGPHWLLDEHSVNLVASPVFHVGGTGWALTGLHAGCHHVLVRDVRAAELAGLFERHRITNGFVVPAVLQALCDLPERHDYSAVRALGYGAAPITTGLLRRVKEVLGTPLYQVYGMTETTGTMVQLDPADHERPELLRSAGRPFPWVELRIADPDTGRELPRGETGEVQVRSDQNTRGYWNRPEETARLLTSDGWLRTGDAGHLGPEGHLFLTDRIKDMIVTGGENVYPVEVEEVLARHPGVADVAVIGVPDRRWGESVLAVVVPRGEVAEEDVLAYGRDHLAGFKRPRAVVFRTELPRNPGGKVLKRDLRAPYWAAEGRAIG
ncbi:long-chain-fatty-acid--CoA ligase [Actinocorallia libanotica]|uniref:Fatty acid--CoA ligase n=1 Tax=Actinocorallia libanotica TaxID=46162 RepID=A0ABP4BEY8_9ACTN